MKTDRIVGLSAIFISLLSLGIFLYQTNLMRQQAYRSVLPYLGLDITMNSHEGIFKVELLNQGIGPAIIESREIFYNGQTYDLDFVDFLEQETDMIDSFNVRTYTIEKGTALATDKNMVLLEVHAGEYLADFVEKIETMQTEGGLDYSICYRSIYDERWCLTGASDEPEAY